MLARFDLVLGVGASLEPEAPGIQRSILELRLDEFSALEVAETILCLRLKSEMLLHVRWVLGGWVVFPSWWKIPTDRPRAYLSLPTLFISAELVVTAKMLRKFMRAHYLRLKSGNVTPCLVGARWVGKVWSSEGA